jgi:hypothetical protein
MKKVKLYRYLGRNGILTTRVLLDGIDHIPMVELVADSGKILSNGESTKYSIIVEESKANAWYEIDKADKDN